MTLVYMFILLVMTIFSLSQYRRERDPLTKTTFGLVSAIAFGLFLAFALRILP